MKTIFYVCSFLMVLIACNTKVKNKEAFSYKLKDQKNEEVAYVNLKDTSMYLINLRNDKQEKIFEYSKNYKKAIFRSKFGDQKIFLQKNERT